MSMVARGSFVSIAYHLSLDGGTIVDQAESDKPLSFVVGFGQMMPGLEKNLIGMSLGQKASFVVNSAEAYGDKQPDLITEMPRSSFPEDLELRSGLTFMADTPQGQLRFTVLEVTDDQVKIDLNHPLAGERLHFQVEVLQMREATEEEIAESSASHCCGHHGEGKGCC